MAGPRASLASSAGRHLIAGVTAGERLETLPPSRPHKLTSLITPPGRKHHEENRNRCHARPGIGLLDLAGQHQGPVRPFVAQRHRVLLGDVERRVDEVDGAHAEFLHHLLDLVGDQLGLARAAALSGDNVTARKAYQDFFALWKDADSNLTALVAARAEYEKLN